MWQNRRVSGRSDNAPLVANIGLYGPPSAGKTSLMWAYAWTIFKRLENEPKILVSLNGTENLPFDSYLAPDVAPEPSSVPVRGEITIAPSGARTLKLNVLDDNGRLFYDADLNRMKSLSEVLFADLNEKLDLINAWKRLLEARFHLVLLDHELLNRPIDTSAQRNTPPARYNSSEDAAGSDHDQNPPQADWNEQSARSVQSERYLQRATYARFVERLHWLHVPSMKRSDLAELSSLSLPTERDIALCLTKVDSAPGYSRFEAPERAMEDLFGQQMITAVSRLREVYGHEHVRVFSTSSFGYDPKDDTPNNNGQGWLKSRQANRWVPYNVQLPFDWFRSLLEHSFRE